MSKVTSVKVKGLIGQCEIRILKKDRWAPNNVKLLHFKIPFPPTKHKDLCQDLLPIEYYHVGFAP